MTLEPDDIQRARALYEGCAWEPMDEETGSLIARAPTREEIADRLRRVTNTAPGRDEIEYRHLRTVDPDGTLLEILFSRVWQLGIPTSWKSSRTVLIHKKGDKTLPSNFRPISLLSCLYKIYTGILASRLTPLAVDLGWISTAQKGFLPAVRGIQEHHFTIQSCIDDALLRHTNLAVVWMDLRNAFGSIPHQFLGALFEVLPIPADLRRVLTDIYQSNTMEFRAAEESFTSQCWAGVRQGDGLSPIIFNLAHRASCESQRHGLHACTQRCTSQIDLLC